jgi:DNA-damage-inducible protein J
MATMITIHAHVQADVQRKISELAEAQGLTVDEAVGLLVTQIAQVGHLPFRKTQSGFDFGMDDPEYDAWVAAMVQEAIDDPRPPVPHEEVRARFAKIRAELLQKAS